MICGTIEGIIEVGMLWIKKKIRIFHDMLFTKELLSERKRRMKRLVIGILAHVDSGKTTLSEGLMFRSGCIRKIGRVDHGDAFLDTNEIEREKGITIFSKQAVMSLGDTEITLLDTPGHIDFSTEMERTLQVLDYAILVISGTDGVQNHTETLWRLLIRYNIPTFIFINKMDISEKDRSRLIEELQTRLDKSCTDFSDRTSGAMMEAVAMYDENVMEQFLETETVTDDDIRNAVRNRAVFPCFFGSALKLEGIDEFLESLCSYTIAYKGGSKFGAKVFKISEDEQGKRLTHVKITGGELKVKTPLAGKDKRGESWSEKADQIRIYSGEKYKMTDCAEAGTICVITGLSRTFPGEGLGDEPDSEMPVLEPVLTYKVEVKNDIHYALSQLKKLEEEEPQLHIIWSEPLQEIHIQLMGEVQLEVLKRIIKERFNMDVEFGRGSISYRETITMSVEGVGHFEPLRHYAEVHVLLEPLPQGSGLKFASECSEDVLDKNWQRLILTHMQEKTHIGVLTGSPITDMKITLVAGRAHKKHTEGGDFRQATYRAIRHGLKIAESMGEVKLLEPWYDFRLEVPTENVGRAMTDIQQMGGEFSQPELDGEYSVISGSAPVSAMRDYHTELTGYTRGKGRLFCSVKGYQPCHNEDEIIEQASYDSEGDIDNPADSVFCAHGAGFIVKWDEVYDYMHVDSGYTNFDGDDDDTEVKVSRYINAVVDDDELLRIFEKTYGPVKTKNYNALKTVKKKENKAPKFKSKPLPSGPSYLLVDGYNIIFAWDELREASEHSLDAARELLISRLCNYRGITNSEIILVFDAYKVKGNPGTVEKVNNINVVYTKEAETADMYIEKVTHELGRKHRVRVATSDSLEQIIILGAGAVRISAREFLKEIEDAEKKIKDFLKRL